MDYNILPGMDGLQWKVRPRSGEHLGGGGHEHVFVEFCKALLPEGGVFVDVGAHVGLYSLRLGRKASKVIAVEAQEMTMETLSFNIEINPVLTAEYRLVLRAAWDEDDKVLFVVDRDDEVVGGSVIVTPTISLVEPGYRGEVLTQTLDTMLEDEPRVDLIKIDVEGVERRVLDGATNVLTTRKPILFIEMHDFLVDNNRQEIERRLEAVDYVHGDDMPYGHGYHWICKPR